MKDVNLGALMETVISELMIPASRVAFVDNHNSLEHALLILTQSGYTSIPVLNRQSGIEGIITTTHIIRAILGVRGYETDKLGELTVDAVMSREVPRMKETQLFFRAFEMSINHPFICVEDADERFVGILTRKTVLAKLYQSVRSQG